MKLYPQHLRDQQHAEIIRRRSYGIQGKGTPEGVNLSSEVPAPRIGKLGSFWSRNSGLSERQAATGLPASAMSTGAAVWLPGSLAGFIGLLASLISLKKGGADAAMTGLMATSAATAALAYLGAVPGGRLAFRSLYKRPLSVGEVDALLESAAEQTETEREYLRLVRDAVRQEVPEAAEADLRQAIQALGEAIDRLPVVTVSPLDTDALRTEAGSLYTEASTQPDRVVSDSLERRADALLRRATAHEKSALYVHRSTALRAEIEAQIAALREGLAAFNTGLHTDALDMGDLSESARRVASEVVSAAAARDEVDSLLTPAYPSLYTNGDTAPVQQVGVGHRP